MKAIGNKVLNKAKESIYLVKMDLFYRDSSKMIYLLKENGQLKIILDTKGNLKMVNRMVKVSGIMLIITLYNVNMINWG